MARCCVGILRLHGTVQSAAQQGEMRRRGGLKTSHETEMLRSTKSTTEPDDAQQIGAWPQHANKYASGKGTMEYFQRIGHGFSRHEHSMLSHLPDVCCLMRRVKA
eukprot:3941530-Rhodomonas_salina.2